MNQDEFEQTVMQELREEEERKDPEFLSDEWVCAFRLRSSELSDIIEVLNEKQ